ncbi:MAG: DUF6048 family protein [Bacteroidales bacterium]
MSTSRFLFLPLLILTLSLSQPVRAQQDTLFTPSVTLGLDVSGLARRWLEPGTLQWEGSLSGQWRKNWFATLEAGFLDVEIEKQTHNYFSRGWFIRAGVDHNLLKSNQPDLQDLLLLLVRYGYGTLEHQSTRIVISNPYWGDYRTSLAAERHHAHWLELGAAIKTRVLGNFYMGWSLRTRLILFQSQQIQMQPFIISGYGKSASNPNLMIHYSLYYKFPL